MSIFLIILLLFVLVGNHFISFFTKYLNCPGGDELSLCLGISYIPRMSLTLITFFTLVFIILIPFQKCGFLFNEGGFIGKIFLVFAISFGFLFVKNSALTHFIIISTIVSVFFLLFQSVTLIDFSYRISQNLVNQYYNGKKCFGFVMIFLSIVLLLANIGLLVWHFFTFWLTSNLI